MPNETENLVNDFLTNACVTSNVHLVGPCTRDDWKCDAWRVTFQHAGESASFDYFTGLGHRSPAPRPWDGGTRPRAGTIMYAELEAMRKPVAPGIAGVLWSLITETSATSQSFAAWCDELGYDFDSRKTHAMYQACQENSDKLYRIFTAAQIRSLSEILQDY